MYHALHGGLMLRTILQNCTKNSYVIEDRAESSGSRFLSKDEYTKHLLAIASYIADAFPQLLTAIPLYFSYLSAPMTEKVVEDLLGQSLIVSTSHQAGPFESKEYCKQTIRISNDVQLELHYRYDGPVSCGIFHNDKQCKVLEIQNIAELCRTIQSFSGEEIAYIE